MLFIIKYRSKQMQFIFVVAQPCRTVGLRVQRALFFFPPKGGAFGVQISDDIQQSETEQGSLVARFGKLRQDATLPTALSSKRPTRESGPSLLGCCRSASSSALAASNRPSP